MFEAGGTWLIEKNNRHVQIKLQKNSTHWMKGLFKTINAGKREVKEQKTEQLASKRIKLAII